MRHVEDTAVAFARACDAAAVQYAFVGGIAVIAWGQPRTTSDVDALMILPEAQVRALHAAVQREKLEVSEADLLDAIRDRSHVTIFDPDAQFHVDARTTRGDFEETQVRAALDVEFKGQRLRVARPEDTVAFKLKFGSEQDLQDARSILVRQEGRLDLARLRDLARRLGVEAALDELMRE